MYMALRTLSVWAISLLICASANAAESVDQDQLKAALAQAIPSYVSLRSLTVEASESNGDKVEPIVRSRIRARMALSVDLFQTIGTLENRSLVNVVAKAGNEQDVYYIATSRMYAGTWTTSLQLQGQPFYYNGKTLDQFATYNGPPIVQGSSDESNIRQAIADYNALVAQSQQPSVTLFSYKYNRRQSGRCNNPECRDATYTITDVGVTINSYYPELNRDVESKIWYGDVRSVYDRSEAWKQFGLSNLSISGTDLFFNSHHDLANFYNVAYQAAGKWQNQYCPKTNAASCQQFKWSAPVTEQEVKPPTQPTTQKPIVQKQVGSVSSTPIAGTWQLSSDGKMQIIQNGSTISVSGDGWSGSGEFDGQKGFYTWRAGGTSGRTTIEYTARVDKILGVVQPNSAQGWRFTASRINQP